MGNIMKIGCLNINFGRSEYQPVQRQEGTDQPQSKISRFISSFFRPKEVNMDMELPTNTEYVQKIFEEDDMDKALRMPIMEELR